jgi:thiol-disulfide isomerase/thioredoxin
MTILTLRRFATACALVVLALGVVVLAEGLVGKEPPEIKAEGWFNAEKGPTLADLKGKVVVVEFWATWCPPCRKSIPHLIGLHEKYAKKGVTIVGLSNEPKDTVEPFVQAQKMNYIVGWGSKSAGDYGVRGIPTAFVIGRDGKVAWQGHPMDDEFEKAIANAIADKT